MLRLCQNTKLSTVINQEQNKNEKMKKARRVMFFSRTIEAVVQKCIDDDEHDDDVTSLHKTNL